MPLGLIETKKIEFSSEEKEQIKIGIDIFIEIVEEYRIDFFNTMISNYYDAINDLIIADDLVLRMNILFPMSFTILFINLIINPSHIIDSRKNYPGIMW